MNPLLKILFLSCLTLMGSFPAMADDEVVGIWSSASRSRRGLAPQWIFTRDGNVIHTFGTLMDFKYEILDRQIRMTVLAPDQSLTKEVSTKAFSIDGDTLTEYPQTSGRKQIMKRAGKPGLGAHPIVGEWKFSDFTGSPAVMRYSSAGTAQLSVPYRIYSGTYRANQGTLSVTFKDKPPMIMKFRWEKDRLVLTDEEARENRYLRFNE